MVVRPDKVSDIIEMKGPDGRIVEFRKPAEHVDKMQAAAMSGTLIDVSPLAFKYEVWPAGSSAPKVGDRVLYAKYAGMIHTGADGQSYTVMNDKDIAAVLSC